jgi:hypothetical protein
MGTPRPWALVVLLLYPLFLASAGCGNRNLSKVEGVVTLDGAPLSGALVSFVPVGKGRATSGLTDSNGYFRLTTLSTDDGAMPGEYKVIIAYDDNPEEKKDATTFTEEEKRNARMGMGKKKMAEKRSKKPPSPVPAIYSDLKRTPLKEVVPTNGKIELALQSTMH